MADGCTESGIEQFPSDNSETSSTDGVEAEATHEVDQETAAPDDLVLEPQRDDLVLEPQREETKASVEVGQETAGPDDLVLEPQRDDLVLEPQRDDLVLEPQRDDLVLEPQREETKASVEESLLERFLNSTPPILSCEDVEGGYEEAADVFDGAGDEFGKTDVIKEGDLYQSEGDDDGVEERQQGDGQESVGPPDILVKVLDFDEDRRNPQYIPKKGSFYEHDDRAAGGDETTSGTGHAANDDDRDGRRKKKLWQDEGAWGHDMFREEEQAPKTTEEIINTYGYDIRSEGMAPRARRRRRYSRGPNRYTRCWKDENAYAAKGSSSFRGGRRGWGHHPPSFQDEDFPRLPGNSPAEVQEEPQPEPVKTLTFENSHYGSEEQDKKGADEPAPAPQRQGKGEWRSYGKPNAKQRENELVRHQSQKPPRSAEDEDWWAPNEQPKDTDSLRGSEGARKSRWPGGVPDKTIGRGRCWRRPNTRVDEFEHLGEAVAKMNVKQEEVNPAGETTVVDADTREEHGRGGGDASSRPKRYSSLRQRQPAEMAASFTPRPGQFYDTSFQQQQQQYPEVAPTPVSCAASRQTPLSNQPTLLPGHYPAYATYPEGYILPPGQPPVLGAAQPPVMTPSQPPVLTPAPAPVMAPTASTVIPGSFIPPPGIVGFTAQYATYQFPAPYSAPAPPVPPPQTTQPQKVCHGGITYYNTQSQQHKQRSTPPRRPKAAIPIVPPPASTVQQDEEPLTTHVEKAEEHYDMAPAPPVES